MLIAPALRGLCAGQASVVDVSLGGARGEQIHFQVLTRLLRARDKTYLTSPLKHLCGGHRQRSICPVRVLWPFCSVQSQSLTLLALLVRKARQVSKVHWGDVHFVDGAPPRQQRLTEQTGVQLPQTAAGKTCHSLTCWLSRVKSRTMKAFFNACCRTHLPSCHNLPSVTCGLKLAFPDIILILTIAATITITTTTTIIIIIIMYVADAFRHTPPCTQVGAFCSSGETVALRLPRRLLGVWVIRGDLTCWLPEACL